MGRGKAHIWFGKPRFAAWCQGCAVYWPTRVVCKVHIAVHIGEGRRGTRDRLATHRSQTSQEHQKILEQEEDDAMGHHAQVVSADAGLEGVRDAQQPSHSGRYRQVLGGHRIKS
jgi:hypothetical protein